MTLKGFKRKLTAILGSNPIFAVSPDGNQLAYSTSKGIYLRSMNEVNAKFIAGTAEKTMAPFFSPDGKWIAYWSLDDLQLKKISILGGTPRPLCNDLSNAYWDWGIDGNIYYAGTKGIMRVSDTGGVPETLIELIEDEAFFSPQLLPGGKSIMFTIDTGGEYKVAVQSIDSDEREILLDGHTARYLPTGHLIYMTGNDIKAVQFDIDNLAAKGGVVTIVEFIGCLLTVLEKQNPFIQKKSGKFFQPRYQGTELFYYVRYRKLV
jgi:Tol biopolymer transport system component